VPPSADSTASVTKGVQQILVLPSVKKACLLCNGTLTFYTLPELSPAYGGKIKQGDCNWIGGIDESRDYAEGEEVVIIICLQQRLRLIRIGEQARKVRDIDLPGCINVRRSGDLACVADDTSYALIDVVNQQKIDLFPITTIPQTLSSARLGSPSPRASPITSPRLSGRESHVRRVSATNLEVGTLNQVNNHRRHTRSSSIGNFFSGSPPQLAVPFPHEQTIQPSTSHQRTQTPLSSRKDADLPALPLHTDLHPWILSANDNEFLLSTGTNQNEHGVGLFINHDGDVSRGTLDFPSYPLNLLIQKEDDDAHIISILKNSKTKEPYLEVQFLNDVSQKQSINLPTEVAKPITDALPSSSSTLILCHSIESRSKSIPGLVQALALRRLNIEGQVFDEEKEPEIQQREDALIARLAQTTTRTIFAHGSNIWWLVRQPILLELDAELQSAMHINSNKSYTIDCARVLQVIDRIQKVEAVDELQFMTSTYIKQKAALLLFFDSVIKTASGDSLNESDTAFVVSILYESDLEPRLILSLLSSLSVELIVGPEGIWIPGGLVNLVDLLRNQLQSKDIESSTTYNQNILELIKSYLFQWRKKKGFGSIADESRVFQTIDAALLHVLLILDQDDDKSKSTDNHLRSEIYELVDHGIECFDRAVILLESFHRLYVLSRLYQSKKMSSQVLDTWRRMLEGDLDTYNDLTDGENDIRRYLSRIKDPELVRKYGIWLANRNPALGVQVFADDTAKVKFPHHEIVDLLRSEATGAVKDYLEHLVFVKGLTKYSSELIDFYLDQLMTELSDPLSNLPSMLEAADEIYKGLSIPKISYLDFVKDNLSRDMNSNWTRHRLRFIELLGSTSLSQTTIQNFAEKLTPFSHLLVAEMIILHHLRKDHELVIRLQVYELFDIDSAIRYCLNGGSSTIFSPSMFSSKPLSAISAAMNQPDPCNQNQRQMFKSLLGELVSITTATPVQRTITISILQQFSAWFDLSFVLNLIPSTWSICDLEQYINQALRNLNGEARQMNIVRYLAGAENLRLAVSVVEEIEEREQSDEKTSQTSDERIKSLGNGWEKGKGYFIQNTGPIGDDKAHPLLSGDSGYISMQSR